MTNLEIVRDNEKIFRKSSFPDMKSEVFTDYSPLKECCRTRQFLVSENTVKETTVECLLNCPDGKKITVLNFANAMFAGGGYILGGNAQEESLCRASMLYYAIKTQKKYYIRNRLHIFPDYTDTLIYSENVPVIRNDRGEKLEKTVTCDFITIPAVNRSFAKFIMTKSHIDRVMNRRIEMLLSIALEKKPDILILGAFGCGMFGNRRKDVYKIFENYINKGIPENIKIIFAVPD